LIYFKSHLIEKRNAFLLDVFSDVIHSCQTFVRTFVVVGLVYTDKSVCCQLHDFHYYCSYIAIIILVALCKSFWLMIDFKSKLFDEYLVHVTCKALRLKNHGKKHTLSMNLILERLNFKEPVSGWAQISSVLSEGDKCWANWIGGYYYIKRCHPLL